MKNNFKFIIFCVLIFIFFLGCSVFYSKWINIPPPVQVEIIENDGCLELPDNHYLVRDEKNKKFYSIFLREDGILVIAYSDIKEDI